ncbi:MAG: hypothetical protein AAGJ94_14845 [Pseudomonadota bacterium]
MNDAEFDWTLIAPDFEYDGEQLDLYIHKTTAAHWQAVCDYLSTISPTPTLNRGEGEEPLTAPVPVGELLSLIESGILAPSIYIQLSDLHLTGFMFCKEEIEFVLDPRDIVGPREAQLAGQFMEDLSRVSHRPVILSSENNRGDAIAIARAPRHTVYWTALDQPGVPYWKRRRPFPLF